MRCKMPNTKRPANFKEAIMAGIEEVRASLDGGPALTRRQVRVIVRPRNYRGKDVRGLRSAIGASQTVFAQFLGTSLNTVRSWEQDTRKPSPLARRFMDEMYREPQHWRQRLLECYQVR